MELNQTLYVQLGQLTGLTYVFMTQNSLTGTIPSQLGQLTGLEDLYLFDLGLTGSLPSQLSALTAVTSLDLSSNQLSGSPPDTLCDLGNTAGHTCALGTNPAMTCSPTSTCDSCGLDADCTLGPTPAPFSATVCEPDLSGRCSANVCAPCCKSYLFDGQVCEACMAAECDDIDDDDASTQHDDDDDDDGGSSSSEDDPSDSSGKSHSKEDGLSGASIGTFCSPTPHLSLSLTCS